jgi:hypothetical protein
MEILFIGFLALLGVGAASVKSDFDAKEIYHTQKQTKIIEHTRKVIYSQKTVRDWQ